MHRLRIPHDRIVKRLGAIQRTISNCLGEMPELANLLKADLSKGLTLSWVVQKHCGEAYGKESISTLPKKEYLEFFKNFFTLINRNTKSNQPLSLTKINL